MDVQRELEFVSERWNWIRRGGNAGDRRRPAGGL